MLPQVNCRFVCNEYHSSSGIQGDINVHGNTLTASRHVNIFCMFVERHYAVCPGTDCPRKRTAIMPMMMWLVITLLLECLSVAFRNQPCLCSVKCAKLNAGRFVIAPCTERGRVTAWLVSWSWCQKMVIIPRWTAIITLSADKASWVLLRMQKSCALERTTYFCHQPLCELCLWQRLSYSQFHNWGGLSGTRDFVLLGFAFT